MGKIGKLINPTVDMYKQVVEERLKLTYTEYTKFLDSPPIFVTYYSQNLVLSTANTGLQEPQHLIGSQSPLRFNKYYDVPLFGVSEANLEITNEDYGLQPNFSTNGILVPETIKPLMGDYLKIDYLKKQYLFRVTSIEQDTIKSNNYFRIEFEFFRIDNGELEPLVVSEQTIIYDNIGSHYRTTTILNDNIPYYENLLETLHQLTDTYKDYFYDDYMDMFRMEIGNNCILYDPFVVEFLKNIKVYTKQYKCPNILMIDQECHLPREFSYLYKNSIFYILEKLKTGKPFNTYNYIYTQRVLYNDTPYSSPWYYYKSIYNGIFKVELLNTNKYNPNGAEEFQYSQDYMMTNNFLPYYVVKGMTESTSTLNPNFTNYPDFNDPLKDSYTPNNVIQAALNNMLVFQNKETLFKYVADEVLTAFEFNSPIIANAEPGMGGIPIYNPNIPQLPHAEFSTDTNKSTSNKTKKLSATEIYKVTSTLPLHYIKGNIEEINPAYANVYNLFIKVANGNKLEEQDIEFMRSVSYSHFNFDDVNNTPTFYLLPIMMYTLKVAIDVIIGTIPELNR